MSGRQACAALCTAGTQNTTAAYSGHACTKAVAALADENTRLIGAFHDDAPSKKNLIGRNCTGFRVRGGGCQCLLPGISPVAFKWGHDCVTRFYCLIAGGVYAGVMIDVFLYALNNPRPDWRSLCHAVCVFWCATSAIPPACFSWQHSGWHRWR